MFICRDNGPQPVVFTTGTSADSEGALCDAPTGSLLVPEDGHPLRQLETPGTVYLSILQSAPSCNCLPFKRLELDYSRNCGPFE